MNKNILLDRLPQSTQAGKIRTDFRESIKFELLMQDRKITEKEKIMLALKLYYYDVSKIKDLKLAINEMLWFYRCGKEIKEQERSVYNEKEIKTKQIYSYEFDDEYIYSAFMEQYRIDLNSIKYMHWWKFKALFNSLNENTQFVKIMGYRSMNLSKIKDKEMKLHYKKLQKLYVLPDMRSEEEKEADFASELW